MPTASPKVKTASAAAPITDPCADRMLLDLDLQRANEQLARYSEELKAALEEQRRRLLLGDHVLRMLQDGLDGLPLPVIGVDETGRIAFVNLAASLFAPAGAWAVGARAAEILPASLGKALNAGFGRVLVHQLFDHDWLVDIRPVGHADRRGAMISMLPMDPEAALADINGTA